ncbi:MAG: DEAD/DEAH box helicase [Nitrospira sp.]|nr:DEAD/DEAH box helicase [Nitrospira sp.]
MTTFADFQLSPFLAQRLSSQGFTAPTPIQAAAIKPAIEGRDILAQAKTGSGKTLAFLIPLIERATKPAAPSREGGRASAGSLSGPSALILAPTRELALQIETELRKYAPPALTSLSVYGGTPIERHYRALRRPPMVIVGTPGRLLDLLGSRHLKLTEVQYVVMDEADQMLDRGFLPDIQRIMGMLPKERQTLLFSATFAPAIQALAETMLNKPVHTKVDLGVSSPVKISHGYYVVDSEEMRSRLVHTLLQTIPAAGRAMVFCEQKYKVRKLAARLGGEAAFVGAITGNHSQAQRERTLSAFRAGRLRSLVATDVAARGLDIPDVAQVIHFELPTTPNSYVHRAGRTGRAEKEGATVLILTYQEESEYLRMVRRLRIDTLRLKVPELVPMPKPAIDDTANDDRTHGRPRRAPHHTAQSRHREHDRKPWGTHGGAPTSPRYGR